MTSYLAIYGNLDVAFAAPDPPVRKRAGPPDGHARAGRHPAGTADDTPSGVRTTPSRPRSRRRPRQDTTAGSVDLADRSAPPSTVTLRRLDTYTAATITSAASTATPIRSGLLASAP